MERDFLGLSLGFKSWNKEETNGNTSLDSAFIGNSKMQWSFSSKVSAVPHYISFKAPPREEKQRKTVNEIPSSSAQFMSVSAAEVGDHYPMAVYPQQHVNAQIMVRSQQHINKQNQCISMTMSNSLFQSRHASSGHNAAGSTVIRQMPSLGLSFVPSIVNSSVETTTARDATTPLGQLAKLTIFYDGTVHVYDNISPEKAQAIMLLAGNGSAGTQNKTPSAAQVQISNPRSSFLNDARKDQPGSLSSFLCPQYSISLACAANSQSSGFGTTKNEVPSKAEGIKENPRLSKVSSSLGSAYGAPPKGVAIPQARKASLARFLEKRKDRVMATSPYCVMKKSP